jgi:DMSO reductase family type II enzyme heme b subunit
MKWYNSLIIMLIFGFTMPSMADITAIKIAGNAPIMDPSSSTWDAIPANNIALLPQNVALPHHYTPAITNLKVKAAHNGQWLGILLEWQDSSKNDIFLTDQYGDQVAIQFPIDAAASPMMGNPKGRVNILQWRAALQRDLEAGDITVHDLYPNALVDVYPDKVLTVSDALPYSGALGLDNPVSHQYKSPVLDQMAEGWGSLTVKLDQQADGLGVWADDTWKVVITLPLSGIGVNAPRLAPDDTTQIAFAVWNGGSGEVGSRKSWSVWSNIYIAP